MASRLQVGCRVVVALLALALAPGCAPTSEPPQHAPAPPDSSPGAARSVVERGPVRVSLEVKPSPARLSDEPTLTLTIDAQQGVSVTKPVFGESLGDFLIREFRDPLPQVAGDRQVLQQVYTLEPTRTGKIVIAPIRVTFTDKRPGGDGKEHALETESVTVEIASALDSAAPSLAELRPAAGPVEIPQPPAPAVQWPIASAVAVLLLLVLAVWWWRRRRSARAVPPLTPRELAGRELQSLLDGRLAERDVKQFYAELTGIVRRYIERTTGIRAPEQTTQEFLREIDRKQTFADEEGRRLRSFLEAADLVKFAAHRPHADDVVESVRRARAFVGGEPLEVAA